MSLEELKIFSSVSIDLSESNEDFLDTPDFNLVYQSS